MHGNEENHKTRHVNNLQCFSLFQPRMASVSAVGLSLEGSPQQLSPPSPTSASSHQISHQQQQEAFGECKALPESRKEYLRRPDPR